jgi:hypothetical protein
MPRVGRPPKPVEQKRRLGNPGKRKLPAPMTVLPSVSQASQMEQFGSGLEMLQRVLDDGARVWIGPTDQPVAELARQLWDDRQTAREHWLASRNSDAFRAYDDLTKRLTTCLSSLGLTPSDRSRLGVAEVKARSKMEELRERRERRAGHRAG